jgi:hypothetical protein
MGSVVGPKSTADVRQFLHEATGVPIEGVRFERTPAGLLSMVCEFKTVRGEAQSKRITMGSRGANLADDVTDLSVIMSEWIEHGKGHMLDLLTEPNEPETVQ